MRILFVLLMVFQVLLGGHLGFGANQFNLQIAPILWTDGLGQNYSPFEEKKDLYQVEFDVSQFSGYSGNYFLAFSKGGSLSYDRQARRIDGRSIQYQIVKNKDAVFSLKDIPDLDSAQDSLLGSMSSNGVVRHVFYVNVPANQAVLPGEYTDEFVVSLYSGDVENNISLVPEISVPVPITITVKEVMELAVGDLDYGQDATVRYGIDNLEKGAETNYKIRVRANVPYSIVVNSKGNGEMEHENANAKTTVPYQYTLGGNLISFLEFKGRFTPKFNSASRSFVFEHDVKLVVGDTLRSFNGRYSDEFTYEIKEPFDITKKELIK